MATVITPTPTTNSLRLRRADFASLTEALDYAAKGDTGANFYARGVLRSVLPYRLLRRQALALARRLSSLPVERGARLAIIAETSPDFLRFFFGCLYAGLVPVAVPSAINLGGHNAYVEKLRGLLNACGASLAMASADMLPYLDEAAEHSAITFHGTPAAYGELPERDIMLQPADPDAIAYLQYTSGSTGFPRGVTVTQRTVMANLFGALNHGLDVNANDRFVSWLPFYHDMGLVGCLLSVMASQRSIDYLDTREFAMRPRRWLDLMSTSGATIAYSPPLGYELCVRRVRPERAADYDLSHWRIAGVGAEPIRADMSKKFAELMAPAGFDPRAFVPSYGMAETAVAISFAPIGRGIVVDWVDPIDLTEHLHATPVAVGEGTGFVHCGAPLPRYEVKICDENGSALGDRQIGHIRVRGPSVMSRYYGMPEATRRVLSPDGWLDTGDVGYMVDGEIIVTGRSKDMIIINGRNIWPQDIEHIAEQQPELRSQDASAFGILEADGTEAAVVVVQCGVDDAAARKSLIQRIRREVHEELGIVCDVELVPRHTIPRTSSGKLSRSATRADYLARRGQGAVDAVATGTDGVSRPDPVAAPYVADDAASSSHEAAASYQ